ncbi:MAG: hypothetical protein CMG58_06730 [Candidatus Marinimicrobia bacterium]|nr:hypothetical protein [Candidatus Neomarinimicrobiota bacterium]
MKFSQKEIYLGKKDPKLKKIIEENGHIVFKPNNKHQFDTLIGIVIAQFISTSAANSIFDKIKTYFNCDYLNENHFEKLNINQIKKLGLSTNKAKTIKELSNLFLNDKGYNLLKLNDVDLNEKLLSVFGIGPWSVNMYEIFSLGKLNVFTSKDAGLRLAMNKSGMIKQDSRWQDYDEYANKWHPYKSIASLHLWKTVD